MAELLLSLPPEWVDDSDVVRERRPGACKAGEILDVNVARALFKKQALV